MQVNRLVWRNEFVMTISLTVTKYHQHSRDSFELISFSWGVERADFSTDSTAFRFLVHNGKLKFDPLRFRCSSSSSSDQNVTQKLCSFADEPLQNRGSHLTRIKHTSGSSVEDYVCKTHWTDSENSDKIPPPQSQKVDWLYLAFAARLRNLGCAIVYLFSPNHLFELGQNS
jgi:hypothetical protein